ncbi:MAG TPA: Cof-type HAD-IIB family hydrolase [Candidatus Acidoferrales bacterium]|nr:Cof-type HAD-IIB family hydrolase [Candidatus Acidoferrales bacterium]
MGIQLIAMDIDGTLLDSQSQLSPDNAQTIAEAASRGIDIVIVTGRRYNSARLIAEQLPCEVELIVSNGALVKSKSGTTHLRSLLPAETARRVVDATEEFRQMSGVIFDRPAENQVIFERIDWDGPFVGPYLRRHRTQVAEVAPLANCLNGEDPVEVMFIGECAPVSAARERLESLEFRSDFTIAVTEYPRTGFSFMDVLGRGVTKGSALEQWARRKGIPRENVMAIGDNWNDREMLEYAGLPVVMGNSIAGLKSFGWATTLTNDQSGVAEAIRTHILRNG